MSVHFGSPHQANRSETQMMPSPRRMTHHRPRPVKVAALDPFFLVSLALLKNGLVSSYYVGEHVDTTVFSAAGKTEALKAQRPLFGVDSSVTFPRSNDQFSLGFEEGFHQLSWFDPTNLGKLRWQKTPRRRICKLGDNLCCELLSGLAMAKQTKLQLNQTLQPHPKTHLAQHAKWHKTVSYTKLVQYALVSSLG